MLRSLGLTLATAESCTGGLVAHYITMVPGASDYYLGGVVSYANSVKEHVLGVPSEVLAHEGAVSPECAVAMARGVRRLTGADIAISTTGVAGPAGGSPDKPVGLVYIAVSGPRGDRVERLQWHGGREENIESSAQKALELLRAELEEETGVLEDHSG
jgi:PncC family amidohydrolase